MITLLLLGLILVLLVRFTDLTWSDNGKAVLGYHEERGEWVINDWELRNLKGADGPYIFEKDSVLDCYYVDTKNKLYQESKVIKGDSGWNGCFFSSVEPAGGAVDSFRCCLQPPFIPESSFAEFPEKVVVISDVEGNFTGFYSFLLNNGIIDEKFNWSFGKGHLVLLGDFMDRGDHVTQVLWLIYKLEKEAMQAGGFVHFVLGNHELLNFQYDTRYVNHKYIAIAQMVSGEKDNKLAYKQLFSSNNLVYNWLKTKPFILKMGPVVFIHGGLSEEVLSSPKNIVELNEVGRQLLSGSEIDSTYRNILIGPKGLLWFRGLVMDYKESYKKLPEEKLDLILHHLQAKTVVLGHTVVPDISADYNGKVFRIDVKHGKAMSSGLTKGLLMEGNTIFAIDDLQNKRPIGTF